MLEREFQHGDHIRLVARSHTNHVGEQSHVGDIEDTVMRWAIRTRQSGPIHREYNVKVLEADLLEDLVEAPLQEGAVDIHHGPHPRLGHAGGKSNRVALANTDIEESVGEILTK